MKDIFFLAVLSLVPLLLLGQNQYSLDDCIRLALESNDKMKIIGTDSEIAGIRYKLSKGAFIPSLNMSNQHNVSLGRVLDPTTYDFVENRAVYDMNATLVGTVTLFSGLDRYYSVGKARLNTVFSQLSVEEVELELKMDVISRFYQILLDKEFVSICESKINLLGKHASLD